jgi:hypothetical protein
VNAYTAVALSMHRDGIDPQTIADQLGLAADEVNAMIAAHRQDAQPSASQEPPVASELSGPQEPATAQEPVVALDQDAPAELVELLAWGVAHDDPQVREDARGAAAAYTALRQRRQVDAELAQIEAEVAEAEERLAALRARESELRPKTKAKTARATRKAGRPERDHDPREVRAWARGRGLPVPDRGQIPGEVLDAWRQHHARPLQVLAG